MKSTTRSNRIVFWEVDTQADFMLPGGKLYVPGAEKRVPQMKRLVDAARAGKVFLVSSADQHAPDDTEFQRFPAHCVRGTSGAEILPELTAEKFLRIPNEEKFAVPGNLDDFQQAVIEKQTLDVFDNLNTEKLLAQFPREAEFVVFGVVTEFCVNLAAKGLLDHGRRVALVTDAIETIEPREGERTLRELARQGARLITTDKALALVDAPVRQTA